uniref:Uncharacterized protein n=1 Tax=Lygus hesperus TaxID=30085 RepID=A0A0A9XBH8_LYGHE
MSGNEMAHLPVQFLSPVSKLTEIDISRNKFQGLDERLVVRLEKVKVHLDDNPWACDLCHITPMLSRVNESTWVKDAVCSLPQNLKGRRFEGLTVSALGWCGTGLGYREEEGFAGLALTHNAQLGIIAAGAAVALLVITMAAVVAGLLYNRHHAAFYYTNEEKRLAEREKMYSEPEKKVSIATIDEITKDPELQVLAS